MRTCGTWLVGRFRTRSKLTAFLIAPTERPPVSNLGQTSSLPEKLGCDVLWDGLTGPCGAQRKTITDLIASVRGEGGDRLGKELEQMQSLKHRFLIIEGQAQWTQDGQFVSRHIQWNLKQQWGVELSCQLYGVMIVRTRSALETCSAAEYLHEWTQKPHDVSTLLSRGNAKRNGWGRLTDKAYAVHVMSSVEGIDTVLAGRLYDHFGRCIVGLVVTEEELKDVRGIGTLTAQKIVKVLGGAPVIREGRET